MTGIMMSHAAIAAQAGESGGGGGGGGSTTYTQGVDFTTLFATSQGFTGTVNKINFGVSYSNTGPLTTLPIGTTVTFTFLDRGSLQPVNVTFTTTETATTFDDTDNSLMVYGYLGTVVVNSGTITDDFGAAGGSAQAGATAVVTEGGGGGPVTYSSPGDYSSGGVILTQIGANKLIVQQDNWSTSTATILALTTGQVIDVVYFGSTSYELTLTSGFVYNAGQDWYEATFTSITPTPENPLDGYVTTITFDGGGGSGGGPTGDVTGTITVGTNAEFGTRYGYSSSFLIYGSISATPAAIPLFFTDVSTYTRVQFNGTTIGTTPTDSMMGTATGVTSLSVTVDGITRTLTTGGPSAGGYSIAGDPFGFATKNGQTLSFSITLA